MGSEGWELKTSRVNGRVRDKDWIEYRRGSRGMIR